MIFLQRETTVALRHLLLLLLPLVKALAVGVDLGDCECGVIGSSTSKFKQFLFDGSWKPCDHDVGVWLLFLAQRRLTITMMMRFRMLEIDRLGCRGLPCPLTSGRTRWGCTDSVG
jgi:hypothetical protein